MGPAVGFFLALSLACYLIGSLVSLAFTSRPIVARVLGYGLAMGGGIAGVVVALSILLGSEFPSTEVFRAAPYLAILVRVDQLSAWFILIHGAVGAATSLAAIGYGREYDNHAGPRLAAAFNVFLATMLLVLIADSVFAFLVVWEAMSLISFLLVVHDHDRPDVRRAGFIYLVMTHLGTAFLTVSLLILAAAGNGLDLNAARSGAAALDPTLRSVVFLGALIGFGMKAGFVPLHVWLPRAHPVAPSHVSALMSGVMLKIALYGFIRVVFDILSGGPAWWGMLVLAIGLISAVLGAMYALLQTDLKTLLAYSSVENVGIIGIGLGAALILVPSGQPILAAVALAAALFHAFNHALFKSLLFLGAGAIDQATGTKDLEKLGGLIRRMPQVAVLFLVGALAIAALPPLNGFASEWLTFQALLGIGLATTDVVVRVGAAVGAGLLALTGALAAACFVKAFGVAFLALPRSEPASRAMEAPLALRLGMAPLAIGSVMVGAVPGLAIALLAPITLRLTRAIAPAAPLAGLAGPAGSTVFPLGLIGALIVLAAIPMLALRTLGRVPEVRRPTWVCGWDLEAGMTYGASSFSKPARLFFRAIIRPQRVTDHAYALAPYFVSRVRYQGTMPPVFEHAIYGPVARGLLRTANVVRGLQNGSLRLYLVYVLVTLVTALILTR